MDNIDLLADKVWNNCLSFIKEKISQESFNKLFKPIKAIRLKDNVLTIQVPSRFFYEHIEENYIKILKLSLQKNIGLNAKLVYSVLIDNKSKHLKSSSVKIASCQKEKPKSYLGISKIDKLNDKKINPFNIEINNNINIDSNLNYNYIFDNFIEGECNRLARAAGMAISKKPGATSFNPFFVYSSVGLGKTHLVNAIGLDIKEYNPNKNVLYVSTEKFTQQFIDAIKNNNQNNFIYFYQMIDVLIMDDIQFLSGKKKTQEVFFHIFNHLHQQGNQIILTCDKSQSEMIDIEDRLISRFKWGLSVDIQKPDFETRMLILKRKLLNDGISLSNEVMNYIANNIDTNIRELEGSLNSLIAQATLTKKDINLDLARTTLSKILHIKKNKISIDIIQKIVCDYFKINIDFIQSSSRKREVVQARQLCMYFAKKYTNASLSRIGQKIGKRDHSTVLHACKVIDNLLDTSTEFKFHFKEILNKISNF